MKDRIDIAEIHLSEEERGILAMYVKYSDMNCESDMSIHYLSKERLSLYLYCIPIYSHTKGLRYKLQRAGALKFGWENP